MYLLKKQIKMNRLKKLWLDEMGIPRLDCLISQEFIKFSCDSNFSKKSSADESKKNISSESIFEINFNQIKKSVQTCTSCQLHKTRKTSVFGYGPKKIEWMLIGEAPGEYEDHEGLPFVGRSGKLLDAMLASIGLNRDLNVFITNVIKCRPPKNRNPNLDEINACSLHLKKQIELFSPRKILAIGKFSAQTILNTKLNISDLRGKVHKINSKKNPKILVVVMNHPAYLLRYPLKKVQAWQDLQIAAELC